MTKKSSNKKTNSGGVTKTLNLYFIPHADNNHRPFIIRPGALKFYSLVLILTKLAVTAFLYLSYPSVGFFSSATASNIVNLTNSSRQSSSLGTLRTNEALNRAAYQKAQDMVANNYFSHDSPAGTKFWNWIQGSGYRYSNAGENLAMDFNSAESVHNALMASTSHRANILNPKFTEIGVSIITGKINNKETMILVEMFGTPKQTATTTTPVVTEKPAEQPKEQPANTNEATIKPDTTPPQQIITPPPAPFFKAEITKVMEASLGIKTGEEINYWIEIKNTGNTTWTSDGTNFVALNTTDPAGRTSAFQHSSWLESYRPVKLAAESVSPSQTTRLNFTLKAPRQAGSYKEAFQLVAENLTWIEGSRFEIPITVSKPPVEKSKQATNTNQNINQNLNQNTNQNLNTNVNKKEVNAIAIINSSEPTAPEIIQEQTVPVIAQNQQFKEPRDFIGYLVHYYDIIFWIIIVLVGTSLLINTLVKIRIQHADTIISSLLVILLATAMLLFRFHFIENIMSSPLII